MKKVLTMIKLFRFTLDYRSCIVKYSRDIFPYDCCGSQKIRWEKKTTKKITTMLNEIKNIYDEELVEETLSRFVRNMSIDLDPNNLIPHSCDSLKQKSEVFFDEFLTDIKIINLDLLSNLF